MGRNEKPVWKYFKKIKIDYTLHAKCVFCGKTYVRNAIRMELHLTKCEKAPNNTIKQLYKNNNRMHVEAEVAEEIAVTDNEQTFQENKVCDINI